MKVYIRQGNDLKYRWAMYDEEGKFVCVSPVKGWEAEYQAVSHAESLLKSPIRIYSTQGVRIG